MDVMEVLSEGHVISALHAGTKAEVLRELVDSLVEQHPEIDADELLDVIWKRERLGSTGIAEGVAIPHGKLPGLPNVIGVFGRHAKGVDFESIDGAPTKLFFLVVSPSESAGQHLKALAQISRLVHDNAFRSSLLGAADRVELHGRLAARMRSKASV